MALGSTDTASGR